MGSTPIASTMKPSTIQKCVVEGYLFLEVRTMNHIINKRDLLLKKIDSVNLTIDDKLVEER